MVEKIILGSDPLGLGLKNAVKTHLQEKGYEVLDIGMDCSDHFIPYYTTAATAAKMIQAGEASRAVLFCGTGMGVAIVANKFKGVYAGVIESEFTARNCKAINNCNVLTMGGIVVSEYKAKLAVDNWLAVAHTEGWDADAEFLRQSLQDIAAIEEEQFR